MSSTSTIFGCSPFSPRRTLVLPDEDGEITLYVLDALAMAKPEDKAVRYVSYEGWNPPFKN